MGQTEDANIVMMPYPQQRYHLICNFKEAIKLQIMSTSYSETDEIQISKKKESSLPKELQTIQPFLKQILMKFTGY